MSIIEQSQPHTSHGKDMMFKSSNIWSWVSNSGEKERNNARIN